MPRLSLSTWSTHHALESGGAVSGGRPVPHHGGAGDHSLLDMPARMAALGINTLEICHFHFPNTDQAYLNELRAALDEAGVALFSILIDAGDITADDEGRREADLAWIRNWLDIAGRCGASHARIIAGEADIEAKNSDDLHHHPAIRMSADHLKMLAAYGRDCGVQVITENFRPLTKRPEQVLVIMDLCEEQVGLCVDYGNFEGPSKYDDLAAIMPHADVIHAKPEYSDGVMDRPEFIQCMDLSREAGFNGPYSLIYGDADDEWTHVAEIRDVVAPYCNGD